MDNNLTTEEVFNSAVSIVRNLPKEGSIKPSDELKLKLYAYFKQATHGPNDTPKPRFYQIVEAYKWDAWHKLGDMTKEEAMLKYIGELKQVMDTLPSDDTDPEESKRFEDVLGKKFYDYWFSQWKQSGDRKQIASTAGASNDDRESSQIGEHSMTKSNDTQSNSSSGSSMSMLEDTQSAGDGYKTPTSLVYKETFTGEVSDQLALAVLRLQHGLDETITKLNKIECQLKQSMDSIRLLENQTYAKQAGGGDSRGGGRQHSSGPSSSSKRQPSNSLVSLLRNMDTVHWFYLSYPFLVYFIIRALDRRNKHSTS